MLILINHRKARDSKALPLTALALTLKTAVSIEEKWTKQKKSISFKYMSPYVLLLILFGGAYGAAFHIWQGKTAKEIFYYCPAGVIGFGLGQIAANFLGWQVFLIGPLHIIEASVGCWGILFLARWLRG